MKKIINNYYKLFPTKLYIIDDGYRFFINDYEYLFLKCEVAKENLNILVDVSNRLYNKKIYVSTFVMSINGEFYVSVDDVNYVLLQVNHNLKDKYNVKDLLAFNYSLSSYDYPINISPWHEVWSKKVDVFEETMSDLNKEFSILQEVFPYYIGLAENAISYCTDVSYNKTDFVVTLGHKRAGLNNSFEYLYNPMTFTFDYDVRDLAEYIKFNFFYHSLNFSEIEDVILNGKLSKQSLMLLFSRLLYPSYFFDLCEKILSEDLSEDALIKIMNKSSDYEDLLNDIYILISKLYDIPKINWLIGKH